MKMDREHLNSLVQDGWLRSQRHPEADLWIYNYTEKTQFENYWTPETLLCRGLILDAEGEIVARPFPKFFNYGTPQAGALPDESFTITEKIDGSLGILYYLPDESPRIATRGSFTSEQALEGTKMLLSDYDFAHDPGHTPLFEIVYPNNRIVIDYGDRRELVLLAVLDKETGSETDMKWNGPRVERHDPSIPLAARVEEERSNSEGYVITYESGLRVKVKHSEYVRLHKIVTGINARRVWEALRDGINPTEQLDGVPDEIFQWVRDTQTDLQKQYRELQSRALEVFEHCPNPENRKAAAEYILASGVNPAILFRMLDGKSYDDLIWKAIKPEASLPETQWTTRV